jgi:hypothetical protein
MNCFLPVNETCAKSGTKSSQRTGQLTVEIKMRVHFNTEISFLFFLSAVHRVENGTFNKRTFNIALITMSESSGRN